VIWDPLTEARRIIDAAERREVPARLVGGLAIRLRAGDALAAPLRRDYADIDLAVLKKERARLADLLAQLGYEGNERFNAMHVERMVFYKDERHVDVFAGEFRMCHTVPLAGRITRDPVSIPLAELLLTKLQVVALNHKDLVDIAALLSTHDLGQEDGELINLDRVAEVCASDWGLWRTATRTLKHAEATLDGLQLDADDRERVGTRLRHVAERLKREPKSRRWRRRALVGERVRWYSEPEEIEHRDEHRR
jgi:hypothetical protein